MVAQRGEVPKAFKIKVVGASAGEAAEAFKIKVLGASAGKAAATAVAATAFSFCLAQPQPRMPSFDRTRSILHRDCTS